jgi:penicillin-binding protein 2
MKKLGWITVFTIFVFVVGCSTSTTSTMPVGQSPSPALATTVPVTETQPSPTATLTPTPVPDPEDTVSAYLDAWKADDYASMYAMLTTISKDAINLEDFTDLYRSIFTEAALQDVDYEILSSFVPNNRSAQVNYRVVLHSVLVGDISRDTVMNLSMESGNWRVEWSDDLIIPELAGGNYLWMDRHIPTRANIYDRNSNILAAYAEAVSVGIIPGLIDPDDEGDLLDELQWLTGIPWQTIYAMYEDYPPGVDWYLPLGETSLEKVQRRYDVSNGYNDRGLLMFPYTSRFYFDNGIAPQAIGYVSRIQEAEAEEMMRRGYSIDEAIGRQGIEKWGESYLGGTRGGTLYVIGPDDKVTTVLADVPARPSQEIYTTLDKDLQQVAQTMLLRFSGAVVVLELNTGRVLAMASSPWYDPNAFEPTNYNFSYQLDEIYSPYGGQPLLNRATQGQYPLGSVFKIVTMAAALESGVYTKESEYDCQYSFTEIQGLPPRYDWTWDHVQRGDDIPPSGLLTLPEGLMRSCNPYFWHIGLDLYRQGFTDAVSEMARGFGLGSLTGIVGVEEEPGNIPDPQSEVDAINNAIGQGDTQVTPLQVARFIAAIANGGMLYRPQIIERIVSPDENPTYEFEPIIDGTLPVTTETLKIIQDAMISVIENRRGTGRALFGFSTNSSIPLAGKTGTAESGSGEPHAWFAGYTRAGKTSKPDIAIVVIAENAGEGSEIALPIFRGILQQYFQEQRPCCLPWEADVGVLATPVPEEEAP